MSEASYVTPPLLASIRQRHFQYHNGMFPSDFMTCFYSLPVSVSGNKTVHLQATRYCSGSSTERNAGRSAWLSAVKKHYGAKGWPPGLEAWVKSDRDSAVFNGHGLPEELSMVCEMALNSGHKTEADLAAWVDKMLGIDCNGFVNAYLTSLGTFVRPLHYHPAYPKATREVGTVAEIRYDSVIVTAKDGGGVKANPSDDGAHIMVVEDWHVYGGSLLVAEQAGKDYAGPTVSIYDIVEGPPKNANKPRDYLWRLLKRGNAKNKSKLVYITGEMQTP